MTASPQKRLSLSQRSVYTQQLWILAGELAEFADQQTEQLDFETYAAISEYETKLLAYADLLSISDPAHFLHEELQSVREFLEETRSRQSDCPQ